jgi:hypothetical protein
MIGRYPDFDVLDAVSTWDEATKKVVLARLAPPGPLRFFTSDEEPALRVLCDIALDQDCEPRIPVAEMVDGKLADGKLDGYQYADMSEFARGRLVGGAWDELNVTRAWSVVMRMMLSAFYSHPWAWNEIGFGGPAYPRGFMRLGGPGGDGPAVREPFEKPGATDEDPVQVVDNWQQ